MLSAILFKIGIIKSPIMRKVRSNQDYITRFKTFDTVTYELGSISFFEMDELHFRMIMPSVIHMRYKIPPHTKRMSGTLRYLEQLWPHSAKYSYFTIKLNQR